MPSSHRLTVGRSRWPRTEVVTVLGQAPRDQSMHRGCAGRARSPFHSLTTFTVTHHFPSPERPATCRPTAGRRIVSAIRNVRSPPLIGHCNGRDRGPQCSFRGTPTTRLRDRRGSRENRTSSICQFLTSALQSAPESLAPSWTAIGLTSIRTAGRDSLVRSREVRRRTHIASAAQMQISLKDRRCQAVAIAARARLS